MKKLKIVLDAGHGQMEENRFDPGAIGGTPGAPLREAEFTYALAHLVAHQLSKSMKNMWTVVFTRQTMNSLATFGNRVALANKERADVFVSIHFNASDNKQANGFEIWTTKGKTNSDRIAESIFCAISSSMVGVRMRSDVGDGDHDKESDFFVLRKTKCPSVLIEAAFITNAEEISHYTERRDAYAAAIARGIDDAFKSAE